MSKKVKEENVYVNVELNHLLELERRSLKLDYLECSGVDNWSGYSEAFKADEWDDDGMSFTDAWEELKEKLVEGYK